MNAPIDLPSDGEDSGDDDDDDENISGDERPKKLQRILLNVENKQIERTFTHEVVMSFLMSKRTPVREEKLIFFTESREWSTFWRNTM